MKACLEPFLGVCLVERRELSSHDRDSSHDIFPRHTVEDE